MPRKTLSGDEHKALLVIGKAVGELRRRFEWSERELARRSGVSHGRINRIENGQHEPSIILLLRISNAFGCGLRGLVKDVE